MKLSMPEIKGVGRLADMLDIHGAHMGQCITLIGHKAAWVYRVRPWYTLGSIPLPQ